MFMCYLKDSSLDKFLYIYQEIFIFYVFVHLQPPSEPPVRHPDEHFDPSTSFPGIHLNELTLSLSEM